MRRVREDLVNASEPRPSYLDEFERKLAAALAQQADTKKAIASTRSSDVNLSGSSSLPLGEALTPSSLAGNAERPPSFKRLEPSSETREAGSPSHKATAVPVQAGDIGAFGAAIAPQASGSGTAGASPRAGEVSSCNCVGVNWVEQI
jgi:hypothetical protein